MLEKSWPVQHASKSRYQGYCYQSSEKKCYTIFNSYLVFKSKILLNNVPHPTLL